MAVYAVALLGPWLLRLAIDSLSQPGGTDIWTLGRYALLMAGAAALANVFSFLQHWRLFLVGNRVEFDYRNDFFRHLQEMEPAFFQQRKTGDIVSLATNDLGVIRTLVGAGSINFLNSTVALISGPEPDVCARRQAGPVHAADSAVDHGCLRRSGQAEPAALRAHAGAIQRALLNGAGEHRRGARGQGLRAGRRRDCASLASCARNIPAGPRATCASPGCSRR